MKYLDKVLELLHDSQWHDIKVIRDEISMPDEKLSKVLGFLEEQAFVNKDDEKIRITNRGLKLLEI
ncbi:Uncharacterised protein [uncultured archaeon]|nr:Uncharacterised protein [uncultured archaeon]